MLRQARQPVKIRFDGAGIEGGQIFLGNKVLVPYDLKFGRFRVQESRDVAPGDKVYLADPRCERFYGSEPIGHQPPVPVSLVSSVGQGFIGLIFLFFRKPYGVRPVDPQNDQINIHERDLLNRVHTRLFDTAEVDQAEQEDNKADPAADQIV